MDISRRFFIGGAAAFGAFGGNRFFEAFGGVAPSKKPNLKFGVVSDIHITCVGADQQMDGWGNYLTFKHTLEWFRDQGVDAVMVAGDMADNGMVEQMKAVAQAWFEVFPDNKAPDGRYVEKLFQMGNHDFCGYHYGDHAKKRHEKEAPGTDFAAWCREHLMQADVGRFWKEIFHEDYSILQVKNVKGYTFIGHHWDDARGMNLDVGWRGGVGFGERLQNYLDANGKSLDPKTPFFYYQHPHPKDTCYGPWAWGHDSGKTTAALTPYANAIAFSGHSHYSLTDERSMWQGAFTSVGTSSLRYTGMPYNQRHPFGYENTTTDRGANENDAFKAMGKYGAGDCRQGMLWNVYDDCIVVQRREFLNDVFVGPDWVMPLAKAEDRPFAFAARAKKAKAPQFAKDAKAAVKVVKGKTRRTKTHESVAKDVYEITFPAALAEKGARPYEYELTAHCADGNALDFHVMAEGFNHALSHKRASADPVVRIACDRVPAGATHFTVKPLDCWWNKGEPIKAPLA